MDIRGIATLETKLAQFPRLGLAQLPTPLEPLKRLSAYLGGPCLWVKRDDTTGLGLATSSANSTTSCTRRWPRGPIRSCQAVVQSNSQRQVAAAADPPPLKWSDLRYVFDIKEDCNGKEAIQA